MSDSDVSENPKKRLRKDALSCRAQLPTASLSLRLMRTLEAWPLFRDASQVLFYYPFRGEIDLTPLVERWPQKRWYLPDVQPDGRLCFYRYRTGDVLQVGKYGILAPKPVLDMHHAPPDTHASRHDIGHEAAPSGESKANLDALAASDLLLIPGLAFDRHGYRLGYGKGYYDRFLESLLASGVKPLTVGVTPRALLWESLPRDTWDIPLDYLATEDEILKATC